MEVHMLVSSVLRVVSLIGACLAVLGCSEMSVQATSDAVPAQRGTLKMSSVLPQDTDPAIAASNEPHFVAYDPGASRRGQLFLLLGGQNYAPADNLIVITRQAAANGFHAIALSYPRTVNVLGRCQADPDESCFEKVRLQVIDGTERAPQVAVNRANSIENRTIKLLEYLAKRFPDEGWGAYLNGSGLDWAKIRLGGHSEGGSHVTMMA